MSFVLMSLCDDSISNRPAAKAALILHFTAQLKPSPTKIWQLTHML